MNCLAKSQAFFRSRYLLLAIAALVISLLFFISPSQIIFFNGEHDRTLIAVWNAGHLFLFFLITWLLLQRFAEHLIWVLVVNVGLAFVIEFLQLFVGRTFSVADIAMDIAGTLLAILVFFRHRHRGIYPVLFVAIALLVYLHRPLFIDLGDEMRAKHEFPVLADFSDKSQLNRFSMAGKWLPEESSLKLSLVKARASTFALQFFPRDWSEYSELKIDLEYRSHIEQVDQSETVRQAVPGVRVDFRFHDLHYQILTSRYDRQWIDDTEDFVIPRNILTGEYSLAFNLKRVKNGPSGRQLDLSAMQVLRCAFFASQSGSLMIRQIGLH